MTKVEEKLHSFICQCDHSIRVVYHFIGVVDLHFLQCPFIMFCTGSENRAGNRKAIVSMASFGGQFL